MFFKPLPTNAFKIPIQPNEIRKLVSLFAEELVRELKNELTASFTSEEIGIIFKSLKELKFKQPLVKNDIIKEFERNGLEYDGELALTHLFDYSVIGNIDKNNYETRIYFKHREKKDEPCVINFETQFIYHKIMEVYLDSRE